MEGRRPGALRASSPGKTERENAALARNSQYSRVLYTVRSLRPQRIARARWGVAVPIVASTDARPDRRLIAYYSAAARGRLPGGLDVTTV